MKVMFAVLIATFFISNGIGHTAKLFYNAPYESLSLSVHEGNEDVCNSAVGGRQLDEWCVAESRIAARESPGHWFVDVFDLESGEIVCSGNGPANFKEGKRSLVMWLSAYSGQQQCYPYKPFYVETVREFYEPIEIFGYQVGEMFWRVRSPVSVPTEVVRRPHPSPNLEKEN